MVCKWIKGKSIQSRRIGFKKCMALLVFAAVLWAAGGAMAVTAGQRTEAAGVKATAFTGQQGVQAAKISLAAMSVQKQVRTHMEAVALMAQKTVKTGRTVKTVKTGNVTDVQDVQDPNGTSVQESDIKALAGMDHTLRITRKLDEEQEVTFSEPPQTYWDRDGQEYSLDRWEMVTVPGHKAAQLLEKQIVYAGVEGAEGLPESIPVKEEVSGTPAEGNLFMRNSRVLKEEWQEGFSAPIVFHSYGADEYHAGPLVIEGDDILGTSVAMGGELLNIMGLSPLEYRILSMAWAGEPYEDGEGQICRQALAVGEKLLRDIEVIYEGEVSYMEPDSHELEMVYRPVVLPPADLTLETEEAGTLPLQEKGEKGTLWYWVRSGFAITVGAGLIGITVGLLTLLILWYRQNRRERRRRYLPQIKG